MRLSTFMIHNRLIATLQQNFERLYGSQEQLTTGKKINRPSDDIIGSARALDYRININAGEQFKRNIDEARSYLQATEGAVSSASVIFSRTRELIIEALNGEKSPSDREIIAKEVEELRRGLLDLANTRFKGRYIFSGFLHDRAAFDTAGNYQGDGNHTEVEISPEITVRENMTGPEVFAYIQSADESIQLEDGRFLHYLPGGGTTVNVEIRASDDVTVLDSFSYDNVFQMMDLLKAALESNDIDRVNALLGGVDHGHEQVLNVEAELGARLGLLDSEENRIDDSILDLRTVLSKTEDADIAEVVSEISKTEVALQALRQSGAQVMNQSLLDFLR